LEITSGKARYELIREIGILVNAELIDEYERLKKRRVINERQIIENLRKEVDDEFIKVNLASVHSIAINLTDQCNFRCGYCVYSGIYKYEREHGNKTIDFETAVSSIGFFLDLINSNQRSRKENTFFIGFYGGEPFTRFDLLKRIILEAEKMIIEKNLSQKFNIEFRVNTNGYLLTDEIADFLRSKNAIIDITIDGPASEHDMFRKTRDGKETWDIIMGNVTALYEKYPEYYKEKVNFLCTVHPLHNTSRSVSFFKSRPELFDIDMIQFNPVYLKNLKPDADKQMGIDIEKIGNIDYDEQVLTHFLKDNIDGKFKLKDIIRQERFTGTCFPGGIKILIDSEGKFHICERINYNFPIGDAVQGFDFDKIRSILKAYNEEIIKNKCWECNWWFLCTMCFAHAVKDNELTIDCKDVIDNEHSLLKAYLERLEVRHETDHSPFISVADYIDSL
jgi:uncharacterized protein